MSHGYNQKKIGHETQKNACNTSCAKTDLRATINKWREDDQMKLMIWIVCLISFFGGFRVHELLSRVEQTFDPAFTLLGQDIKLDKFKCGGKLLRY